jgi:hypothetical protein
MDVNGAQIIPDEQTHLLDQLEGLLKKQLELAHQGHSTSEPFSVLTAEADSLVATVRSLGVVDSGALRYRCEQLRELYEKLCLVVAAERAEVREGLGRIRRGRKIIGTYRPIT